MSLESHSVQNASLLSKCVCSWLCDKVLIMSRWFQEHDRNLYLFQLLALDTKEHLWDKKEQDNQSTSISQLAKICRN